MSNHHYLLHCARLPAEADLVSVMSLCKIKGISDQLVFERKSPEVFYCVTVHSDHIVLRSVQRHMHTLGMVRGDYILSRVLDD